ncbi:glycosyltransferase [Microbulbifer sp. PSTR4-B]|uniref:glycosyltransferase n=1 Tax=Microbulbifer sp. PSTR4-B TaxID=3243396 RepID=UPI00403989CC
MDELLKHAEVLADHSFKAYTPIRGRIAYMVSHGQSYASNGYAVRTQGIAKSLNKQGFETLCFIRPGRPWELCESKITIKPEIVIDGVRYIHSRWPNDQTLVEEIAHLESSVTLFTELFKVYRPEIVLAASDYIVGLPAWVTARRFGLPFFNEVRGFWEFSRAAREPGYESTTGFRVEAERNSFLGRQALRVFTLNQEMKSELIKRGIDFDRIDIVPNGVSELPRINYADPALKKRLGILSNDKVIGYVGSFSAYEEVDILIHACNDLIDQGEKIKLLLVGDDQMLTEVIKPRKLPLDKPWLIQIGRVPHEAVEDYYRLIDAVVIPRKSLPVSNLVPPLKVAEALAYGKRLVVSNVAPLTEYAINNDNVVTFESGIVDSLVNSIQAILSAKVKKNKNSLQYNVKPFVDAFIDKKLDLITEFSPLKKYTKQPSLGIDKDEIKTESEKLDNIPISTGKSFKIQRMVYEGEEYSLTIKCVSNDRANPKGAVADVSFYNKEGITLPKPYKGMAKSKAFGSYFYVETFESKDAKLKTYTLTCPPGATHVSVNLVAFGCKSGLILDGDYKLISTKDRIRESSEQSKYIDSFNQALKEAKAIPDSNGSEYYTKHNFRVGVIADIYMYNFYKDVFTTVKYLSPTNYPDMLEQGLDIIIYTTCWKGIDNEEWRGVKFREKPKKALDKILAYAKEHNIKTVFQTIEDPSNFEYFLPVAEKFEYILTTDTNCIERYKKELNHDRVYFGEYGVNPQLNNPIGCRRKTRNAAFFAGSYPRRYKERCEDMEIIFDSIVGSGGELLIADRNFGADTEDLIFPERFQLSVLPPVQHTVLQKLHKLFRYNLNFNSIKQSPTMCAMRVYELQAQGNGLISNYANSVFNKFPGVRIVPFKQNMSFDFTRDETWEEYSININNIREVLNNKTSYQVVSTMLENIGLKKTEKIDTTIAVICTEKTDEVIRSFKAQAYPRKILIEESELEKWEIIKEDQNVGYFCWFSTANDYEKNYLNDLLNGFKYTNSRYITKNSHFDKSGKYVFGKEHEYTELCSGKALSLFSAQFLHPDHLSDYCEERKFIFKNGYSIDPFEINFLRYMKRHSTQCRSYQLSVIVPVYNNGRFLISKCIPSLQRNKLWPEMEVILVDDGSDDQETLQILKYMKSIHPNVKARFNHGSGSGSASRPRNQGIDMATAPLITFLDPDNEIAPGAYDLLTELYLEANQLSDEPVEFISGYHVKVAEDVKTIGKHTPKRLSIIKDFKKGYFNRGRFPVIATQSAVISKKFLDANKIRFVEKSAGQDTLFGWEVIAKANCGGFNCDAFIIYYADRSDSITNKIDLSYFEKKLILEKKQVEFLRNNDLLNDFVKSHFDNFMTGWYLTKLNDVVKSDYEGAVGILEKICDLYNKDFESYVN